MNVSGDMQYVRVGMYHIFLAGCGVNPGLNGGFWVERLITDGIPPFMFGGINVVAFTKHVLPGPCQSPGSQTVLKFNIHTQA